MLNSKMKRSMAWIMSVAVVMTAAPVSAADFTDVADVETTAEQETCSNKKAGADTGRTLAVFCQALFPKKSVRIPCF